MKFREQRKQCIRIKLPLTHCEQCSIENYIEKVFSFTIPLHYLLIQSMYSLLNLSKKKNYVKTA